MLRAALRNSVIYGLASILSKGLTVLLLPLHARVLSPGEYGVYDLLITFGALANLVVAFEISQGLARYLADVSDLAERKRLASTCLWFSVLMYGMFVVLGMLIAPHFNNLVFLGWDYLDEIRIGFWFISFNGIYYLLLNQFRWEMRSKTYAIVSIGNALLTLCFVMIFSYWLSWGLFGVMLAQLVAAFISLLICLWLLRHTFSFVIDLVQLRAMLNFSVPLVPAGIAVFINLYINRIVLNYYGTLSEVGLFGVGSRIAGLASLLILGLQVSLTPLVYKHYRETETPSHIARLFNWFMALALIGCLFLGLFAREILILLATPEFMDGAVLIGVLAPALLLSQMYIFAPGIAIAKKTQLQLWVTIFSAVVSVFANWILVPIWGVLGAASATLISSITFFICWIFFAQREYKIPYCWRQILISIVVFIICMIVGSYISTVNIDLPINIFFKILIFSLHFLLLIFVGIINYGDLKNLFILVKKIYIRFRRF